MTPTLRTVSAVALVTTLVVSWCDRSAADERLRGIACRSVHLAYPAPAGLAFYNEVTVDHSAPGTYFCVCGFNKGYFGLQELANGKKLVIFSVWDPGQQNDPRQVAADQRVKLLHQDDAVRIGRFGNEGTGGQSFFDIDWKPGETYRFLVTATVVDKRTEFAAWFYINGSKSWKHLVTFSTITEGKPLGGYYAFVEDFRRNRESTKLARIARFGGGWVKPTEGEWQPLTTARFTADANPVTNIDAGKREGAFFLATGGDTQNTTTRLNQPIKLEVDMATPPADLPALEEKTQQP